MESEKRLVKIAFILPEADAYLNNGFIEMAGQFKQLKIALRCKGFDLNTIDVYSDIRECDWFLFHNIRTIAINKWYRKIVKLHLENKTIYWMGEPECVIKNHSLDGLTILKKYYKYFITWNKTLIDNNRVYLIDYPLDFTRPHITPVLYRDKRLLTLICGCKTSNNHYELYSERLKVIQFFESDTSNRFTFYGRGWERKHLKNWGGVISDKLQTYQNFKFALCLENQNNTEGGVSEKIIDCFLAGIVPVYMGVKDILDYIPQECFISYADFSTVSEMVEFLESITEEKWYSYICEIEKYLKSKDTRLLSADRCAERLEEILKNISQKEYEFSFNIKQRLIFKIKVLYGLSVRLLNNAFERTYIIMQKLIMK